MANVLREGVKRRDESASTHAKTQSDPSHACNIDAVSRGTGDDASAIFLCSNFVPTAKGHCINLLWSSSWNSRLVLFSRCQLRTSFGVEGTLP